MYATTAPVALVTCSVCGSGFPHHQVVFGGGGHTCLACDADAAIASSMARSVRNAALAGPGLALAGFAAGCAALVLPSFLAPLVWVGFGMACLGQSVSTGMTLASVSRSELAPPSGGAKAALVASSAVSAMSGFVLVGLGALGFGAFVVSATLG